MELKVNEVQQTVPVQQTQTVQQTDDTFKFMLASNIEEAGLAERLTLMMEEIVMQGDKIVKRMDVGDMRRYRTLIKGFMNEIVNSLGDSLPPYVILVITNKSQMPDSSTLKFSGQSESHSVLRQNLICALDMAPIYFCSLQKFLF